MAIAIFDPQFSILYRRSSIILLVTAPSNERRHTATAATSAPASTSKASFSAVPSVAQGGGGLMLQGVFQ